MKLISEKINLNLVIYLSPENFRAVQTDAITLSRRMVDGLFSLQELVKSCILAATSGY